MHPSVRYCLAAAAVLTLMAPASADEAPGVVASIKPVHSLVAGVMDGIGTPHLLVSGGDSPHTYAMRPSDANALAGAKVVFWIGREMEAFLDRPIANLGSETRAVELIRTPGLTLYDYEDDDDGAHGHAHADGHDHDHAHEHDHTSHDHDHGHDGDHASHDHAHDHDHGHAGHGHHDHVHAGTDGHIWLDPSNARVIVARIVEELSDVDPAHADAYRANGERLAARLTELESDVAGRLAPYRDVPFYTFHEAFRYFAERFDLHSEGAITVSPEVQPGARRVEEIRARISENEQACVFAEPQFPPRLVDTIVDGTPARTGVVDPLGAEIADGPELYFELIDFNADAFAECFAATM